MSGTELLMLIKLVLIILLVFGWGLYQLRAVRKPRAHPMHYSDTKPALNASSPSDKKPGTLNQHE